MNGRRDLCRYCSGYPCLDSCKRPVMGLEPLADPTGLARSRWYRGKTRRKPMRTSTRVFYVQAPKSGLWLSRSFGAGGMKNPAGMLAGLGVSSTWKRDTGNTCVTLPGARVSVLQATILPWRPIILPVS
jgi:hypothetical protein